MQPKATHADHRQSTNLLWRSIHFNFALSPPPPAFAARLRAALAQYVLIALPVLISVTFVQATVGLVAIQLGAVATFELLGPFSSRRSHVAKSDKQDKSVADPVHTSFTVAIRAFLQLLTIVSILAVDFHIYPRYFAKTETYGISLMDLGVGGFIFSSGLVAGPRIGDASRSQVTKIGKTLQTILVPMILGLARMLATKSANYQEHVTEYGVHWNFFFTLSIVALLVTVQSALAPRVNLAIVGIVAAAAYQYVLSNGLEEYILNAPRVDLISMNREGIFSLAGYYCIFMITAEIGKRLQLNSTRSDLRSSRLRVLIISSALSSAMYWFSNVFLGIRVSRRMANAPYVFFVISVCTCFLTGLFVVESIYERRLQKPTNDPPLLFTSVNSSQLATFLVSNLMTGLVNLTIDTLSVSNTLAFCILAEYMLIVLVFALSKYHYYGRKGWKSK